MKIAVPLFGLIIFVAIAASFLAYRAYNADTSLESDQITVNT